MRHTIQRLFFHCRFARTIWSITQMVSGLPKLVSVLHVWQLGGNKNLKPLLLGGAAICWSIWLRKNDIVFGKENNYSPLQVSYMVIYWFNTWSILQKLHILGCGGFVHPVRLIVSVVYKPADVVLL